MKKVILNKTSTTNEAASAESTYHRRKKMEPQYKELFKVLFTLPDKDVVNRVIAAINGEAYKTKTPITHDVGTQTDWETFATKRHVATDNRDDSANSNSDVNEKTAMPAKDDHAPKRRRRKRKVCVPQAQHVSQAQALRRLLPKPTKQKPNDHNNNRHDQPQPTFACTKRARSDSVLSLGFLSDSVNIDEYCNELMRPVTKDDIYVKMAEELCQAQDVVDGLLPIHIAIIEDDRQKLQRQIFVWKDMKKVDLNELISDDGQDCLQLAISTDIRTSTVKILLEKGLNVNCIDDHSNTLIHLAILNEIKLESLELLMEKIELSTLLKLNDAGHSPLHIAVRHDRYLHAEVLLNAIDKRVFGRKTHTRIADDKNCEKQKDFLKYYENACDRLEASYLPFHDTMIKSEYKIKRKFLELGEACSGNTAFFHALENRMEHTVYFLLTHLIDPRCPNHNGQDSKSYFAEFSKTLSLSLKIDRTMDKVIDLIDKLLK